jgi:hypothetical protein
MVSAKPNKAAAAFSSVSSPRNPLDFFEGGFGNHYILEITPSENK